jgi:hypothetical protein
MGQWSEPQRAIVPSWGGAGQTFAGNVNLWKRSVAWKSPYTAPVSCTEIHRVKN